MPIKFKGKKPAAKKTISRAKKETKGPAYIAVETFEKEYKELLGMQKDFKEEFPEASRALDSILRQEDLVRQAIQDAHSLVQLEKTTIGPFKCSRRWTKACYDSTKFTEIIPEFENGGDCLIDLIEIGLAKVVLESGFTEYAVQNPDVAKSFEDAWKEKTEKTPAVTSPKI